MGDVASEDGRLNDLPGKTIMKYGTGQLDRTPIGHGLIDAFHLSVFPLTVGSGAAAGRGHRHQRPEPEAHRDQDIRQQHRPAHLSPPVPPLALPARLIRCRPRCPPGRAGATSIT
jgi:hypothetical protein